MVLIHVKKTDTDQFLYETTIVTTNDALISELVRTIVGSRCCLAFRVVSRHSYLHLDAFAA